MTFCKRLALFSVFLYTLLTALPLDHYHDLATGGDHQGQCVACRLAHAPTGLGEQVQTVNPVCIQPEKVELLPAFYQSFPLSFSFQNRAPPAA